MQNIQENTPAEDNTQSSPYLKKGYPSSSVALPKAPLWKEEDLTHQELRPQHPPSDHHDHGTYTSPAHQFEPLTPIPPTHNNSSAITDVAKYLMRRELVSTTIQKFDDEPQNYRTWKSSFLNVIKDLSLSPREELDLLIKWLGPQSSEQARRVSAAQIYNVVASLEMVWQRLEESYGAPEVIEHALFKKMENFAKISAKDNSRLRELGDLLLELELAKAEGHSPGLAFLDTARGVNPIVEKLPHTLQEKWISCASKFKTNHNVAFPPFSVFSQFVREQARIRNDPSFFFLSTGVGKAE